MRWVHDTGTRLRDESGRVQQVSGVARDITERKEIERILIEKERSFRAMFEQAAVGIVFLDLEGHRVQFNRRFADILGYDPDELTPQTVLAHPDEVAAARERRERLLRGEATITRGLKRYIRKDGSIIWCDVTDSLVLDAEDRPLHILVVIQDVSERIRTEERLRASEALFRSTVNAMVEGVTVHDSRNRIVAANPSMERMTGFPAAELIGRGVEDPPLLVLREDGAPLPAHERPSGVALRTGAVQKNAVAGLRRPDGTLAWLSINAQPLWLTDSAAPDAVVTTYQDVTESRAAAQALRESERRHRTLLSHLQGMAYRCRNGERWTMEFVSDGCRGLLGIGPEDLTSGRVTYDGLIHPEDRERVRQEAEAADAGRRSSILEYRLRHARGEWIWVLEKGAAVRDEHGELVGFEGFVSDISDRVRAEEEVRALNITLERRVAERTGALLGANRELEAFSYSVSHDLRAPLGAIRGFADALMESCGARLDPADRHYLERIRAGGARMDALIDDMLSLSRISRADLVAVDVDVSALALEVLGEMCEREPVTRSRFHIQPGMRARADTRLLRIALTNLIGNAWKFSTGREEIVIEVGQLGNDGLASTFFVRDEGAGFDPAHSQKLFGTFQRLHTQSEFPGTGIGLATVRRVIERHGGRVWAEGAVGKGATFYFTLPKAPGFAPAGRADLAGWT
jgi:PAS domain S-box-containing protein